MNRPGKLSVHSENILPIIKKWLYSDKDIFLRELVSNATDAIQKTVHLDIQGQELLPKISIEVSDGKILIADTGIGMTAEEVEKYIAQIAFSGAEEFVAKFEKAKEEIIGHFGLGFYSAYMVARQVDIDTLSYLPDATPVFWSCDGSSTYTIGEGQRKERGTTITLHLDEENAVYLNEAKVRELLHRYCRFLPYPLFLNGKPINNESPLWLKNPSDCTDEDYLKFYHTLFPADADPIFWIHLNVDYPFHLKGILYFPKVQRRFDLQESSIRLFCNRVFVSDHCKDILPDFLTMLRGAIDSPDIPLNVSRSYLQVDSQVKQLSAHISKKVSDRLASLFKSDKDAFIASWPDIETIIKLGLLQDDKFYERTADFLIWKNSDGAWVTLSDYLSRNKEKVYYSLEDRGSPLMQIYRDKKIEVLFINHGIDTAVLQRLEDRTKGVSFQRIDGTLGEHLLDSSSQSDIKGLTDLVRTTLDDSALEVEAKSLASDKLHAFLLLDENQRRLRDYLSLTQGKMENFPAKKTFILNTNSKLIQRLEKLSASEPSLASELIRQLYDLSLLSQKELDPTRIEAFASRQSSLLETLVAKL